MCVSAGKLNAGLSAATGKAGITFASVRETAVPRATRNLPTQVYQSCTFRVSLDKPGGAAIVTPFPILLSRVLLTFERDYASSGATPSLPILANMLRVLEPTGVDVKEMPSRGRITVRAVRITTQALAREGLVASGPSNAG